MQQTDFRIIHTAQLKPALWQITLGAEGPAIQPEPGQFYLARCADPFAVYLRRAVFPACIPAPAGEASLQLQLILSPGRAADPGLAWLVSREAGQRVNLLGPLGRGFTLPPAAKNLLLAGVGPGIGPLLGLAHRAVEAGCNVALALQTLRAADLYPTHTLPPAIEVRIATLDGSLGHPGRIIHHLDDLALWADAVCAVGPAEFYRNLQDYLLQNRMGLPAGFAQILRADAPLHICGVGVCTLCQIATPAGPALACHDGPVFDLTLFSAPDEL